MTDDEEELYEELAERWGVDPEDIEALQEALDFDLSLLEEIPLEEFEYADGSGTYLFPNDDYMQALAEGLDMKVHDLYEQFYAEIW